MTIGENIRMMRRRCGLTQEALAAKLSVTPQAVSKWENGGGLPDLMQIMPLAQIFGITTESLQPDVLFCENLIRSFFPKCYADQGAYDRAAAELMQLAQNAVGIPHCVTDDWTNVPATLEAALARLTDVQREEIMRCDAYQKAAAIMERIHKDDSTI